MSRIYLIIGVIMSIKEYISEQDKTIQPKLELIYNTIHDAIPDAEERLSWGMPTFWKGRNIIHFAPASTKAFAMLKPMP